MKKLFFAMLALALMGVACQKDFTAQYDGKDAVNVTIGVDIPDLEQSRSGETEMNSALGAIDNFSADEWSKYDVRYMLEVFDVTPGYENLTTPVKKRMVNILPEYAPTMFELRLIPGRTYKFVVWADFVTDGTETDLNYNTADLRNITRTNGVQPMDESMDAYFIQEDVEVTEGLNKSLTLTRPFGKLRVVTTDIDEVNIGTIASKVDVTFYNHPTFTSLNAITGKAETEVSTVTYSYNIDKSAPYTKGYDAAANNQTIFADYIFAQPQDAGAQEINFTMAVTDQYGRDVRTHDFSTQIPLKRNHLTTIIGNLLTTYTEFEILIDDNFENAEDDEDWIVRVWDGKMGTIPAPNAEGVIEISNPADFAALLASDYKGLKVALTKDIDFGGYEIKHAPKMATSGNPFVFDGQGHTVANFTVSDGVNAGLFSVLVNATVKNLTIKDAVVAPNAQTRAYTGGDFYAGALAGTTMATCTIENVKVINCEVEGVNKVGGLIGNAAENWPLVVKNCSVEDSTIYTSSTEDGGCVGGFIGYIVPNTTLEGNTVKNTTINAINSANEAKRANAEFVGAFHGNGKTLTMNENTLEGNTFTQAETSYVTPEDFGAWLGGIRLENGSDVIIDGKSVVYKPVVLATPVVEATVEGNVITLAWAAIENAATYTVTVGTEMPVVVEEPTYVFTGTYETEYSFTVVAVPADEKKFVVSEAATVTATTEAEPAPIVNSISVAEFLAAAEDDTVYQLTGVITKVANTTYGNFDLTDATGTVYIYGLYSPEGTGKYWAESGAKLGDTITIQTVRTSHNGSPQGKNAIFVELVPFVETASEWGVVGDLNGWNAPDVVMYNTWKAENLFVAYNVEIASGAIKVRANNEWNNDKNYGLEIAGKVYADQYYSVVTAASSQNITPMVYGTYDVYFDLAKKRVALVTPGKEYADATNGGDPIVVIEGLKEHAWGLVGSFAGSEWNADVAMAVDGDWAVAKNVTLANGNEFKFRADGAWALSYGAGCDVNVGETYTTYENGNNMKFVGEDGAYNIYFSLVDAKFYMETYISATTVEATMANLGFANAALVETITLDENVTLTFEKGGASTAPTYYNSGEAVRLYQNGAIMKVSANGRTISSIEITFANNMYYVAADSGELTEEAAVRTWTGSAESVKFTCTGTSSSTRAYIKAIKVTYE